MIGIPDEDFSEIYELKKFLKDIIYKSKNNKANITISFSTFVPKPHTPLQWEKMNSLTEIIEKQKILKDLFFKEKKIFLKLHNPYMSILEGVISRGDESLNKIIEKACENGAVLSAWDEKFNFTHWQNAFTNYDIDYQMFINQRSLNENLPWDFIDTGLTKEFLLRERERFKSGEVTEDCRVGTCNNCGVCDFKEIKNVFSTTDNIIIPTPEKPELNPKKYLIVYTKNDDSIFLGNLDIIRLWHRLLRMSDINISYTKGFNPQPKIDTGWALPLGIESYCELVKVETENPITNINIDKLKSKMISGINIIDTIEFELDKSLDTLITKVQFFAKTLSF